VIVPFVAEVVRVYVVGVAGGGVVGGVVGGGSTLFDKYVSHISRVKRGILFAPFDAFDFSVG
jgi:hypothetical protein